LNLYGTIGGAERGLLELLAGLDRGRWQPLVVTAADGPFVAALRARDVETIVIPFPTPPLWWLVLPWVLARLVVTSFRLLRLIRARRVRLAHCGDLLGLLLLLPARAAGVRILHQLHYLGGRPRRIVMSVVGGLAADAIVAYSSDQRDALRRGTVFLERRTTVVHPGIDVVSFARGDRERVRRELGISSAAFLVGMLARYDAWKGHATFLDAAERVRAARSDVEFVIAGGALNADALPHVARLAAQVEARARSAPLAGAVHVLGHRDDVADVLAALDVFVCPSEREPFGLVIVEAMAAGTPVVASDTGGPVEIVEDERSGLLFRTGDAEALAARVLQLQGDAPLRARLAAAGRERAARLFPRERYACQMQELYARLA
jgi:glycosyltransferase involved in cell wall biosynthesis